VLESVEKAGVDVLRRRRENGMARAMRQAYARQDRQEYGKAKSSGRQAMDEDQGVEARGVMKAAIGRTKGDGIA
jgi:hypothetical protein